MSSRGKAVEGQGGGEQVRTVNSYYDMLHGDSTSTVLLSYQQLLSTLGAEE